MRRIILILIFIIFAQLSFLVFILPSWLNTFYKEKDTVSQTEKVNRSISALNASSTRANVRDINQKLVLIDGALDYQKFLPVVDVILSKKTNSIVIEQFAYKSNSATTSSVIIQGVSATRESLSAFIKSLQDSGSFKKIDSPISNFAKDRNIEFSIGITLVSP